ncbi:hypothetical protein H8S20_08615 [Clostridium sp. NSJ-6]|uniref:Uncharacterized protein n=1 Tax=Clostridium hominis TaxID=2763036 RepID=A0ABR7DDM8_9CLOT|nr:hypothetical protein [Clostridium hominis]MBC5628953.1 hypothetical protein [Clostridium hominis]MDU2671987.1 hypothetical protein [Clostridium sp.]
MDSNKNPKNKKDNDLTFAPMNIQDALKPANFPTPNITGGPMSNGTMYMCFPAPSINMMNPAMNTDNMTNIVPSTPYPSNIPDIEKTEMNNPKNTINSNTTQNVPSNLPSNSSQLEYPSEVNSEDLYSYNKPRLNDNYDTNLINPLDILRNFSFEDIQLSDGCRGDSKEDDVEEIFKKIEENNSVVLATMKAYRIPYPIAKLLIKNIIKLTLEYKGR